VERGTEALIPNGMRAFDFLAKPSKLPTTVQAENLLVHVFAKNKYMRNEYVSDGWLDDAAGVCVSVPVIAFLDVFPCFFSCFLSDSLFVRARVPEAKFQPFTVWWFFVPCQGNWHGEV
jgi:hypothetical protein